MSFYFRSQQHRERFLSLVLGFGKTENGKVDPEYGAAFYILACDSEMWGKAQGYVSRSGILLEDMLAEVDFSSSYRVLVKLAGNLFNGNLQVLPVDITWLDEPLFQVAMTALTIRRRMWPVSAFREG